METPQLLEPFFEGARTMVQTMFGEECERVPVGTTPPPPFVSGIINLDGRHPGQLALSLPCDTATRMVATMLDLAEDEVDQEMLGDAVGELANIIAGSAKERLADTAFCFSLSLPSIILGHNHAIDMFKKNFRASMTLTTRLGTMTLTLWMSLAR